MTPDARGRWPLPEPYDFFETTRLLRTGTRDPTLRREPDGLWRTAHAADGPVTVRLTVAGTTLEADAWGPGAGAVMADIPRWVGLHEPPWDLPRHPVVDRLLKAHRGLRATDTRDVFAALVPVVLQQLVTWEDAASMWRRLCTSLGDRAPGPVDLRLSPTPRAIRGAGTLELQAAGIGMRQVRTLIEIARVAHALQRAADLPTPDALDLLQKVRGVGPWTANMALGARLGLPDAIPVGDFHLPHTIAWALAGEPRGTDARMLELLAPFPGQAFRVVRLVSAARIEAPKYGPRYQSRRR
jgi:3-methyladenine DNA glycosylase/8-oxoguanine DNA glycosylase